MNLMQIQDEIQNIPNTPEGMQLLMAYANGSNPSVVPEYIALGELSRRRQFENVAKQVAALTPKTTIKDQLTQAPQMVNPAAGIVGVNPAAPAAPVNPMIEAGNALAAQERPYGGRTVRMADGGLAAIPAYMQDRLGVPSVPLNNMFNPSSYAGGGIVAFQNNPDQPVDPDMSDTRGVTYLPRNRGGENYPREISDQSTLDRLINYIITNPSEAIEKAASVGQAANPLLNVINRARKTEWLPPQETPAQQQAREADVAIMRANSAPIAFTEADTYSLTPEAAERIANTTELPEAVARSAGPTTAGEFIAADAAASAAGRGPAAGPSGAPRGGVPYGGPAGGGRPTMDATDEQLLERRRALLRAAGVSDDPFAEANKRQAAMEARQQEKYAQDPLNRVLGALGAYAKSDPTKGMAGLGSYTEASDLINKEQTAYRDKQEQAAIEYQMAVAKEKEARARDDVKSVEAARAAQEKAKLDWAKLDIDRAQLGISAANANIKNLEYQLQLAKSPYQIELLQAQIKTEASKVETAEERLRKQQQVIDENIRNHAIREIQKDKTIEYWTKERNVTDPQTASVINSYIQDLEDWHLSRARNPGVAIPRPEAPVPGKKKTNFFGSETREFEGPAWVRPNAPAAAAPLPAGLPPGSRIIGTSKGNPVYETPSGEQFTVQ